MLVEFTRGFCHLVLRPVEQVDGDTVPVPYLCCQRKERLYLQIYGPKLTFTPTSLECRSIYISGLVLQHCRCYVCGQERHVIPTEVEGNLPQHFCQADLQTPDLQH